ncbi:hypothetical protein Tco_0981310 [Tanacetum coccineum]
MDISKYLSQAIIFDMDACVSKTIGPPKKRYCNDFSLDKMVNWAEMEIEKPEGVESRTSTTEVDATDDKGKEKVSQDATEVVETRRSTVEIDSETEYDSDDDSDYQLDNSVDYLSPDEEELIKLRNRIKANREAKAKAKDNPVLEMNETNNENSMPADNVRGETFEEHDIYMNELLKSLNTADKDGITEDPFISIEKHVEMYLMYDETTHRRLRKPKVGEKVVAKCGQRPPRLSDPVKEDEHTYVRNFNFGSLVKYKWITKVFGDKIRANPDIRLCDIADLVMKRYKCKVSPNQCTDAKKYALTEYEKTIGEHYSMLRSYEKVILDSNLGSTVKLGVTMNPDGKTYFDRFYVCFVGLSDGWKARCRKIIALDGSVLKSPNQVVNVENKDNWTWFIELLEQDLGSSRGNGLTLMSDQHKGLIEAVKDVMPNAKFWHVIPSGENLFELMKARGPMVAGCGIYLEYLVFMPQRGPVRNEGAGGSRGGARESRGRRGAVGSRGGASGSRGGASVSRGVVGRSIGGSSISGGASGSTGRGAGGSGGASRSRGRGASGSGGASGSRGRGASGSKRKHVSTAGT